MEEVKNGQSWLSPESIERVYGHYFTNKSGDIDMQKLNTWVKKNLLTKVTDSGKVKILADTSITPEGEK